MPVRCARDAMACCIVCSVSPRLAPRPRLAIVIAPRPFRPLARIQSNPSAQPFLFSAAPLFSAHSGTARIALATPPAAPDSLAQTPPTRRPARRRVRRIRTAVAKIIGRPETRMLDELERTAAAFLKARLQSPDFLHICARAALDRQ